MSWPGADWLKALEIKPHQAVAVFLACGLVTAGFHFGLAPFPGLPSWALVAIALTGVAAFSLWLSHLLSAAYGAVAARLRRRTEKFVSMVPMYSRWHMGRSNDKPAMQVMSRWYVTNLTDNPVVIVRIFLDRGKLTKKIEGEPFIQENIEPGFATEVSFDFWVQPAFRDKGESFSARIEAIDILGRTQKTERTVFVSDWKPEREEAKQRAYIPKEELHSIEDPVEKAIAAILKDEVHRYEECGRQRGGLGSVQISYEGRTLAGIGYQGRPANSPDSHWIVPDPEKALLFSDNLNRILSAAKSSPGTNTEKVRIALSNRISENSEYAPVGYLYLFAMYRLGFLSEALDNIREKLKGSRDYAYDNSVMLLSGLLQYEHQKFSDEMLDVVERFSTDVSGNDYLLQKRLVAARANLAKPPQEEQVNEGDESSP